jgi:hypothetical protein
MSSMIIVDVCVDALYCIFIYLGVTGKLTNSSKSDIPITIPIYTILSQMDQQDDKQNNKQMYSIGVKEYVIIIFIQRLQFQQ